MMKSYNLYLSSIFVLSLDEKEKYTLFLVRSFPSLYLMIISGLLYNSSLIGKKTNGVGLQNSVLEC